MTVMEYMARFTELAHFGNDYVATDMDKVRRFENGLKLSIQGKIVGLRLQDMDSMVKIALAIQRERDGGRTGHSGCECRWEEKGGPTFFEFGKEIEDFSPTIAPGTGLARADDILLLPSAWTYETGFPTEVWILGFWAGAIPVQWDRRIHSLFLHTPVWVKGTSFSRRVLYKHLRQHR